MSTVKTHLAFVGTHAKLSTGTKFSYRRPDIAKACRHASKCGFKIQSMKVMTMIPIKNIIKYTNKNENMGKDSLNCNDVTIEFQSYHRPWM